MSTFEEDGDLSNCAGGVLNFFVVDQQNYYLAHG